MRSHLPALAVSLAVSLVATAASPGGIDQSGQPVTLLFQDGDYAELTLGYLMPRIRAHGDAPGTSTGNAYGDLADFSGGIKRQLGARLSAALIVDQPYGVIVNYDLDYPAGDFAYAGTRAEPQSLGVTGLVRYALAPRWSVHGGLRAIRFGGEATLAGAGFGPVLDGYDWQGADDWGLGYVLGGAYEVPEIALRLALTYGSETDVSVESVERHVFDPATGGFGTVRSETGITMPQSVNLDFQTGLTPRTLIYGTVRWADWEGWSVAPAGYVALVGAPLVEFEHDTWHYELGLGRQLGERVAGSFKVTHETATGDIQSALTPYDGFTAFSVGASYAAGNGLSIAGSVQLSFLGDAEVSTPAGMAHFDDNHALAVGLRIGYRF
jgi:long-subunit fatty acid transport protein